MAAYVGFCLAFKPGFLGSDVVGTAITMLKPGDISLADLENEVKGWAEARWPRAEGWERHQGHVTKEIERAEAEEILATAREKAAI